MSRSGPGFIKPVSAALSRGRWRCWRLSILCFTLAASLRSQEFTAMAGAMTANDLQQGSYAWELEYRRGLDRSLNLEASVAWINEGHVDGHHRDGDTVQVWWRVPILEQTCRITVGAGPYFYYDTRPLSGGATQDLHGTAGIISVAAAGNTFIPHLIWSVTANRIDFNPDLKTTSVLVGVGAWLGREDGLPPGNLPGIFNIDGECRGEGNNEIAVYGGWSVVNTLTSPGGEAFAVEYRRILTTILDGSICYIHEGATSISRRSGLGFQVWPISRPFSDTWELGIGVGGYLYLDRNQALPSGQTNRVAMAGLLSPMVSYRIGQGFLRFIWDRVVTNYNRDSDVWLAGAGLRF